LIISGVVVLTWAWFHIDWREPATASFLAFFIPVTVPLLYARIRLAPQLKAYAMEDVAVYAMVFNAGPQALPHWAVGAWAMFVASLIYECLQLGRAWLTLPRLRWERVFYNFTNPFAKVIYLAAAGAAYAHVNRGQPFLGSWRNFEAIVASVAAYMVAAIVIDLADSLVRTGKIDDMVDFYSTLALHIATLAPLGMVLAILPRAAVVLLAVPLAIMHHAMKATRSIGSDAMAAIESMTYALEERDQYTSGHSERVARYSGAIATVLNLPPDEIERIENAGRIHDLGKIDIPDCILRKPSPLDDEEYVVMKSHTDRTRHYCERYPNLGRHIPFDLAAHHHERYDGEGYVYGLKGEAIPLGARILSVADTWDAMTSDRPYRKALPDREALRRLIRGQGTQFDPRVVEAFQVAYGRGEITRIVNEWKASESLRLERKRLEEEAARAERRSVADGAQNAA
jgi:HD-GYP domain-containing protein (c-di-GMP phosphodiesterase class II)